MTVFCQVVAVLWTIELIAVPSLVLLGLLYQMLPKDSPPIPSARTVER